MGETRNQPFQVSFNTSLRVAFQGSRVASDGDLILVREPHEHLGFSDLISQRLTDSRRGKTRSFRWPTCCGRLESICYHPLLLFKREGECLATKLRPGECFQR